MRLSSEYTLPHISSRFQKYRLQLAFRRSRLHLCDLDGNRSPDSPLCQPVLQEGPPKEGQHHSPIEEAIRHTSWTLQHVRQQEAMKPLYVPCSNYEYYSLLPILPHKIFSPRYYITMERPFQCQQYGQLYWLPQSRVDLAKGDSKSKLDHYEKSLAIIGLLYTVRVQLGL